MRMLDICGHEKLDITAALEHRLPLQLFPRVLAAGKRRCTPCRFACLPARVISCAHAEYRVVPDKTDRNTESYFAECILLISDYLTRHGDTTLTECTSGSSMRTT